MSHVEVSAAVALSLHSAIVKLTCYNRERPFVCSFGIIHRGTIPRASVSNRSTLFRLGFHTALPLLLGYANDPHTAISTCFSLTRTAKRDSPLQSATHTQLYKLAGYFVNVYENVRHVTYTVQPLELWTQRGRQ